MKKLVLVYVFSLLLVSTVFANVPADQVQAKTSMLKITKNLVAQIITDDKGNFLVGQVYSLEQLKAASTALDTKYQADKKLINEALELLTK
jgi:hypothetical protein